MESCVQVEDPDSRDSGISLAQSTASLQSCSQSTLTNAIGEVELQDNDDVDNDKENYDQFDEDTADELPFSSQFVDQSPIKKRLRPTSRHKPTDFSFLRHSKDDKIGKELETTEEEPNTKQTQEHSKPLGLSVSHDTYENWHCPLSMSQGSSYVTSSSLVIASSSSSSTVSSIRTQFDVNDHLLPFNSLSSSSENELPPSVRSTIHRVHSTSVLECSRDRSWGSPDTFEKYSLATVERPQVPHRAFRSIGADTMAKLLGSLTEEQFKRKFILIDCRYPYEYDAGHIWFSVNLWETNSIEKLFYPEEEERFGEIVARIPIFYCEYSQKRGPKMALALREHDRARNEARYPYVDYKEMYLLDRGYRYFFKERKFNEYCIPQAYVQMWDSAYAEQRKSFDSHRRVKKRRRNHN